MSDSTSAFIPGQRVHHPSFGAGRVSEAALPGGTVRVLFSNGLEPLVRADSLMPVPSGFEPVYLGDNRVADYARTSRRDGFSVEEIVLLPSGERVVWIASTGPNEWITVAQARELVSVLQSAIDAAEA